MPKLFVGNLPFDLPEDQLHELFAAHGTVKSATIINDRETGRSRGFGFVEMATDAEAQAAIGALNNADVSGRKIVVNAAKPMEPRGGGGGGRYNDDRGGRGGFRR